MDGPPVEVSTEGGVDVHRIMGKVHSVTSHCIFRPETLGFQTEPRTKVVRDRRTRTHLE